VQYCLLHQSAPIIKMILAMKATSTPPPSSWLLPSSGSAGKLFLTGATLGPVIDSLHNQCLLTYKVAPLQIATNDGLLFASSWLIPPLLGLTYVVLGGILPRWVQHVLDRVSPTLEHAAPDPQRQSVTKLGLKAVAAVLSTAAIVKLSALLVIGAGDDTGGLLGDMNTAAFESASTLEQQLLILITAAIVQWAYLDGTLASLLVASLASVGGPLAELPFVAAGLWEYLPEVADYLPLQGVDPASAAGQFLQTVTGGDDYGQRLALSSITGPCYFAVTMDSIALGRFFDATTATATTTEPVDDVEALPPHLGVVVEEEEEEALLPDTKQGGESLPKMTATTTAAAASTTKSFKVASAVEEPRDENDDEAPSSAAPPPSSSPNT